MAKYYGKIGYRVAYEKKPGVWSNNIIEREYYGDVTRCSRRLQTADKVNDNVTISNEIRIVADPFAYDNFHSMLYAEFMGSKWKISNVEVSYPRLILSLGEVYNVEDWR